MNRLRARRKRAPRHAEREDDAPRPVETLAPASPCPLPPLGAGPENHPRDHSDRGGLVALLDLAVAGGDPGLFARAIRSDARADVFLAGPLDDVRAEF